MKPPKLLFKCFNYPLFVPEQNRAILRALEEHGVAGMVAELDRLSSLGSVWAASTLGYLSLLPSAEGARDPQRAIDLCAKAAAAGDPYALYITSWAQLKGRDTTG
jgi:TPR repeat protein